MVVYYFQVKINFRFYKEKNMQKFVFLGYSKHDEESQRKAFSKALKNHESAAVEGAFFSEAGWAGSSLKEFYEQVDSGVNLIVANVNCLSSVIIHLKDHPKLKKVPILATSLTFMSWDEIVGGELDLYQAMCVAKKNEYHGVAAGAVHKSAKSTSPTTYNHRRGTWIITSGWTYRNGKLLSALSMARAIGLRKAKH